MQSLTGELICVNHGPVPIENKPKIDSKAQKNQVSTDQTNTHKQPNIIDGFYNLDGSIKESSTYKEYSSKVSSSNDRKTPDDSQFLKTNTSQTTHSIILENNTNRNSVDAKKLSDHKASQNPNLEVEVTATLTIDQTLNSCLDKISTIELKRLMIIEKEMDKILQGNCQDLNIFERISDYKNEESLELIQNLKKLNSEF